MELLHLLSMGYAAVLVVALAVILVTILFHLWRIGSVLNEVRESLAAVRDGSAPLGDLLQPLGPLAEETRQELEESAELLRQVEKRVEVEAEPRLAGRGAP